MVFDKNPSEIIAEIKLLNESDNKSFVLVEGPFDFKFLRSKVHKGKVEIINCQGRNNVEEVSAINMDQNIAKIIGITDRDYDFFNLHPVSRNADLVYTDYNDLETTILSFGIAEKLIQHVCDIDSLASDGISLDNPKLIFKDSLFIGKLRYLSKKESYDFPFQKKYPMERYYDSAHIFQCEKLISDFCSHTRQTVREIELSMSLVPEEPLWHILRGHDCLCNLYHIIQKYKAISLQSFCLDLHVQCMLDFDIFKTSTVYQEVKSWEKTNECLILL